MLSSDGMKCKGVINNEMNGDYLDNADVIESKGESDEDE